MLQLMRHSWIQKNGKFTSGVITLGVAEDGVDWAADDYNATLLTADMKSAMGAAKKAIISGDIVVHNYEQDMSCPY